MQIQSNTSVQIHRADPSALTVSINLTLHLLIFLHGVCFWLDYNDEN